MGECQHLFSKFGLSFEENGEFLLIRGTHTKDNRKKMLANRAFSAAWNGKCQDSDIDIDV